MPTVLLVEDNELNRDMLSRRLERNGFSVSIAIDGEDGWNKATQDLPDLILMDVSLPKMDGLQLSRMLKANGSTKHIPILVLTASAMDSDRDSALESGAEDFDTKPIDLPRLLDKMRRLLNRNG